MTNQLDYLKRLFSQNKFADLINEKLEVSDQVSCKTILELIASHEQLQIDAKKDYEDMRKFQLKFIESDHKIIDLEDKLDKACAALEKVKHNGCCMVCSSDCPACNAHQFLSSLDNVEK